MVKLIFAGKRDPERQLLQLEDLAIPSRLTKVAIATNEPTLLPVEITTGNYLLDTVVLE